MRGKWGVWKNLRGEDGEGCNHCQQHVAPCAEEVEWGLGTTGFRIVVVFWVGIMVSST